MIGQVGLFLQKSLCLWSLSASNRLENVKVQRKLTLLCIPLPSQWALFIKIQEFLCANGIPGWLVFPSGLLREAWAGGELHTVQEAAVVDLCLPLHRAPLSLHGTYQFSFFFMFSSLCHYRTESVTVHEPVPVRSQLMNNLSFKNAIELSVEVTQSCNCLWYLQMARMGEVTSS